MSEVSYRKRLKTNFVLDIRLGQLINVIGIPYKSLVGS